MQVRSDPCRGDERSAARRLVVVAGSEVIHLQPQLTSHAQAIGDRLGRYEPEVLAAWRRHLRAYGAAFDAAAPAGM